MIHSKMFDQYRKWVIQRGTESFPVTENEEGNLEIESLNCLGRVNFYENETVELVINTIPEDEIAFFLHFQLNDMNHAKELYYDLEEAMRNMAKQGKVNILLTCSSALTTSYYAELLNEAAKTLGLKYSFRAVSFDRIETEGKKEDVILLAPQVHFERKKVQEMFKDKIVINIPAQTFGKYDTGELINLIKGELSEQEQKQTPKYKRTQAFFETTKKILTIGYMYSELEHSDIDVICRYYKNGNIEYSERSKVKNVDAEEIVRLAQQAIEKYPEIEIIGLSLPGAIENGVVFLDGDPIHMQNIEKIVQEKTHKQTFAFNDANMIATGIYWLEDRYRSLIVYYLPHGGTQAGCGIVVNGHLIRGYQNVAGEVKFMKKIFNLKHSEEELADTEEGNLELVSKTLIAMIATIGPEAVFVYSYKIQDMDELKKEIAKAIDESFIPDLLRIEDIGEYMMTGTFLRCIWKDQDLQRRKFGLTHNPYVG